MSRIDIGFNLLPKKSKELIEIEKERDNTIIYVLILIFASVFLFFVINLIDTIIIQGRINSIEDDIDTTQASIDGYREIKLVQGELIEKSRLLDTVLERDIQLTELLDLSEEIVPSTNQILSYKRDNTGTFSLSIATDNYIQAINYLNAAQNNERTEDVRFSTIIVDPNNPNRLIATIEFKIIA